MGQLNLTNVSGGDAADGTVADLRGCMVHHVAFQQQWVRAAVGQLSLTNVSGGRTVNGTVAHHRSEVLKKNH